MKHSTTRTFGGNHPGRAASVDLAALRREAQAWIAAMPITILLAALLDGFRHAAR